MDDLTQQSVLFVSLPWQGSSASLGAIPVRGAGAELSSWGRRGLALGAGEDAGAELRASFACSSGEEGAVRSISCPRSGGHWGKEEVSSSLCSCLLSPSFSCPSPSLSGFLLSVSRFPQQQGHKIHSLAFRSLMGRPSVCTVVLLLTYFCKAGIFPSKN